MLAMAVAPRSAMGVAVAPGGASGLLAVAPVSLMGSVGGALAVVGGVAIGVGALAGVGIAAVIGVVVVHGGALDGFLRLFGGFFGGAALGLFGLAVGLVKQG